MICHIINVSIPRATSDGIWLYSGEDEEKQDCGWGTSQHVNRRKKFYLSALQSSLDDSAMHKHKQHINLLHLPAHCSCELVHVHDSDQKKKNGTLYLSMCHYLLRE